jgi:hypothetical protein
LKHTVTGFLPENNGQATYRIKHFSEEHGRVAHESETVSGLPIAVSSEAMIKLCRPFHKGTLAKFLQYAIAQPFGIALTGFRKLDNFPGDKLVGEIASVCRSESDTRDFECKAHNSYGLGIEFVAVQEWPDRHDVGAPPST